MEVTVNGQVHELPENITVAGLLDYFNIRGILVAVEVNKKIVPRDRFNETVLQPGDRVEIIHFVGGG
ncbi:MAG: sulfur carrier protein [Eubacteriales bacterium]|nr:sulfur carrier protein [Eubacteriales bacterium]MDN5363417.1 sulfur carrier protein [Eubacteriales bacterium]